MKRLYKSKDNKVLSGVIGGIGQYFDVDPVILRVAWVVLVALSGFMPGVAAYFLAILVMPEKLEE